MTEWLRFLKVVGRIFVFVTGVGAVLAQDRVTDVIGTANNQFRLVNTYPEYWADGKPCFLNIANFNYYRIPRDRWAEELVRLQSMGINTLDILPMWNWHQPTEDVLDFNGSTNPRRDLDYLLRISQEMGFKILLRPGPYDTNDWRNGGYPDWLLRRPEYHTSEQTILEGRFPPLSALQYEKQDESSKGWLSNATHLKYARKWYRTVLGHVRPLLADKGGPIIGIQLEDDVALGLENYSGSNFWKYLDQLRQYAKEATGNSPVTYFIDAADMRVNAEANDSTSEPFWNLGQDYQQVGEAYEISGKEGYSTTVEAANNKFFVETLKTQPLFVPAHIEFQAGWRILNTDTYSSFTDPSNTLLATRVMFQNGLKGLGYFPMHDVLNPAGYEAGWTNQLYGFEAAVNYSGQETARAPYVRRNGRFFQGMGPLFAASHFLPDAAVVYPMATFRQAELKPEEAAFVGNEAARLLWSVIYDHFNFELIDSDHAPQENFDRYKVLLLPNLVSTAEDLELHPHLARYSKKAQQRVEQYVAGGGTLIVFPSLPKGEIFDSMLSLLGNVNPVTGDGVIRFTDGAKARLLERRFVLKLPVNSHVRVFARDEQNQIVGARFAYGKGQVLFFGGDFSLWSVPRGAGLAYRTGAHMQSTGDYSEEDQWLGRAALVPLMKEAGVQRKVDYESKGGAARDANLYVSELVSDQGSEAFEKRAHDQQGYGFVGVTNFSPETQYSAELKLADPRAADLGSLSGQRNLVLPVLTVPPRESVLLPLRIPLLNPYWKVAPGLEAADEIYYSTCELTDLTYDEAKLRLEFTAPADGEVALRLSEKPRNARVDGEAVPIEEKVAQRLWVVKIAKGSAPNFVRTLELEYPRPGLQVAIRPDDAWISGERRSVRVRVENLHDSYWVGSLDFAAGVIAKESRTISIPHHSAVELTFGVNVPTDAVENQSVELEVTLRPKDSRSSWGWQSLATIHHSFTFGVTPFATFPLREDQPIPIVHPVLASINLPGTASFQVQVRNWRGDEQTVLLRTKGGGLIFDGADSRLVLPPMGESTATIQVVPNRGSGVYRFEIDLKSASYEVSEAVVLVAVRAGDAVAYALDYDRDGYDDVILENQRIRLFISPFAGGRAFAFVLKDSNANAFDSVGAMRDNFSMRILPDDLKGHVQEIENHSLESFGLFNRPYSYLIVSSAGAEVNVRLEYFAADVYPRGVQVERSLSLRGGEDLIRVETTLTPRAIDKHQSYVLEESVPFRDMQGPNYNQWFCLPPMSNPREFAAAKDVELTLRTGVFGTVNGSTGDRFAIMVLTPAEKAQLSVQNHSAIVRITYPNFLEANKPNTYRVAYYFGRESQDKIENIFEKIKHRDNW